MKELANEDINKLPTYDEIEKLGHYIEKGEYDVIYTKAKKFNGGRSDIMFNNFVLVGKIKDLEFEDEKGIIIIEVTRDFKNEDGKYESDLLQVQLTKNLYSNINDYGNVGDVVGIKGKMRSNNILIAEKISILQSSNK